MNKNMRLVTLSVAMTVALSACSSNDLLKSKKIDYKSASKQSVKTLETPPDLIRPQRSDRYLIPEVGFSSGTATYSSYTADRQNETKEDSQVLAPVQDVHLERSGSQRWLVIEGDPEKYWSRIKDFWVELGFVVNFEEPESGIMETDWAENRALIPQGIVRSFIGKIFDEAYSSPERDKFRTRLEKGKKPGSFELYISNRKMYEEYADRDKVRTIWVPKPADTELEAEMLQRMMVYLGVEKQRAQQLVMQNKIPDRASLSKGQAYPILTVENDFARAWRRVGLSLDRIGFTVEDRDRSQGLYYVRYALPEDIKSGDDGGFFSRLAFWRSKKDGHQPGIQYRIQLTDNGANTQVVVQNAEGGLEKSVAADKILDLLYEQLK